jgi:O-antigen/teichoic acid export membrane protein
MSAAAQASKIAPERERPAGSYVAETREALVRNVSFDMVARVGYLASRLFIPPFVLARVGLSAYGLWSAVFVIVSYVGTASVGFYSAYVKFVAEFVGRGERENANSMLSTGMVACAVVCGGFFILIGVVMPQVLRWFSVPTSMRADAKYLILLVMGVHLADVILSVFKAALEGCQKILEVQCVWVFDYLLEAVLIFYFVSTGRGLYGLADAFAISTVASIVAAALVAWRSTPWLRLSLWRCSRESLQMLANFGGVLQLNAMLGTAIGSLGRVIAAPLIGLDAVGLLDIAGKFPTMSGLLPGAFASAYLPASSYLHSGLGDSAKGKQALQQLYLKGTRYMLFVSAGMAGFMATAAASILLVWIGRIYPGTAYLMTIFAIRLHLLTMTGTGTSVLRGMGRPWQEFVLTIATMSLAAVMIPLSRLVLGGWSLVGLGTAMAGASIVASVVFVAYINRILEIPWRQYLGAVVMPSVTPYLVGALVAVPLGRMVAGISRWGGVGVVGLAGMLYLMILALVIDLVVLSSEERLWFREIIRRQTSWVFAAIAHWSN